MYDEEDIQRNFQSAGAGVGFFSRDLSPGEGVVLRSGARVVLVDKTKTPYHEAVMLWALAGIGGVIPPAVER